MMAASQKSTSSNSKNEKNSGSGGGGEKASSHYDTFLDKIPTWLAFHPFRNRRTTLIVFVAMVSILSLFGGYQANYFTKFLYQSLDADRISDKAIHTSPSPNVTSSTTVEKNLLLESVSNALGSVLELVVNATTRQTQTLATDVDPEIILTDGETVNSNNGKNNSNNKNNEISNVLDNLANYVTIRVAAQTATHETNGTGSQVATKNNNTSNINNNSISNLQESADTGAKVAAVNVNKSNKHKNSSNVKEEEGPEAQATENIDTNTSNIDNNKDKNITSKEEGVTGAQATTPSVDTNSTSSINNTNSGNLRDDNSTVTQATEHADKNISSHSSSNSNNNYIVNTSHENSNIHLQEIEMTGEQATGPKWQLPKTRSNFQPPTHTIPWLEQMTTKLKDSLIEKDTTTTTTTDQQENTKKNSNEKEIGKDMNIVLFYADDWTWRSMGLVNDDVKTPHIDELGKTGMLFPYNSVTASICWQSRATLVTGLYVAIHQQLKIHNKNMFDKTVTWALTLYPLLKTAGYNVGYYGKWHGPMQDKYRKITFDHFSSYYGSHWMLRDGENKHVTQVNGEDAIKYLRQERPPNQKFALTVSFFATHGWDSKRYPEVYSPMDYTTPMYEDKIPVPKTATRKHWDDLPWFFDENINEGRKRWKLKYDTPEHFQVTMKRYYRMATEVDDVVGAVVQELKDQGLYDNTYIIFTTDNGQYHGEHGLSDKWWPHEESIRVPLVIRDPRMPEEMQGTVNEEFTLNIDLAPTILSAAGIPVPSYMQGRDIADLYRNGKEASKIASQGWRNDFFYEWSQGRPSDALGHGPANHIPAVFALIGRPYKYFYWPQEKYEQVFHLGEDPYEELDLYNQTLKENPTLLSELKARYAYLKNRSQSGDRV